MLVGSVCERRLKSTDTNVFIIVFPSEMLTGALMPFKISKEKALTEECAFAKLFLPAERAGSKDDIAGLLPYLASREGAYVNGSIVLIDGGKGRTVPAIY